MRRTAINRILLATAAVMLISSGIMAQPKTSDASKAKNPRSSAVVIAVRKGDKLEFAREKALAMKSMQTAFEKIKESEVVKDITFRTAGKANYLGVMLEDSKRNVSTIFIELVPVSEGSAFHTVGPHVVTCVPVTGCAGVCVIVAPGEYGNSSPSPDCRCWNSTTGYSLEHNACNFRINRAYMPQLLTALDFELLANGFSVGTDEGNPREANPRVIKTPSPGRE